jgi:hypothetical protein
MDPYFFGIEIDVDDLPILISGLDGDLSSSASENLLTSSPTLPLNKVVRSSKEIYDNSLN